MSMELEEKKKETFKQIKELAESQGWETEVDYLELRSVYYLDTKAFISKKSDDLERPSLSIYINFKDTPYIEQILVNLFFPDGYLELISSMHMGIEELPKLLERIEMLSELPETISKYLKGDK